MTTTTFEISANLNHPEIEKALAIMLRNDPDHATQRNGIGFDGAATEFGNSVAKQAQQGRISDKQHEKILGILWKHNKKQLAPEGIVLPDKLQLQKWLVERERLHPYKPKTTSTPTPTSSSMGTVTLQNNMLAVKLPDPFFKWVTPIKSIGKDGHSVARYTGDPDKLWVLPVDWLSDLLQVCPTTNFTYTPEVLNYQENQQKRQQEEEKQARIKALANRGRAMKLKQAACLDDPLPNGWLLHDYQKKCVEFVFDCGGRVLIGDDLGLGKTIQSLVAAKAYQQVFGAEILCIVPISTMSNWLREADYVGCKIKVVGQTAGRIPTPSDFKNKFVMIADECHAFKNLSSARTKKWLALCESPNLIANIAMSATPIKNGAPLDIFPILKGLQHPLGSNRNRFVDRYGSAFEGHLRELHEIITVRQPVMIRRMKKDVLDLPPFTREVLEGVLSPSAQKQYNTTFCSLQEEYNRRVADDEISNEGWELVMLNYLRHAGSVAKIETAVDTALQFLQGTDGLEGEQVVLFTTFRDTAEKLTQAIQNAGFSVGLLTGSTPQNKRQPMFDDFQAKKLNAMVAMAQAGGVGINLFSASKVILVDRDYNLNEQLEGRCHRQGQQNPVTSFWLSHTIIDSFIDNKLIQKAETSGLIMEGIVTNLEGVNWVEEAKTLLARVFNGDFKLPEIDPDDPDYLPEVDELF